MQYNTRNQLPPKRKRAGKHWGFLLMNRLFRTQQQKYELVIYDLMYQGYQSVPARVKQGIAG